MRKNGAKIKLIQAFFHLLENHHYTKISVADLINEAGCSRTTFYRHYTDVIDMYDKICEQMLREFLKELAISFVGDRASLSELFDVFCEKLESQKYYILLLCGKNGGRRFFEIVLDLSQLFANDLNPFLSENEKFTLKFIVFSGIGSYVKSLMDKTEFDKNYLLMYKSILTEVQKAGDLFG